MKPDWRSAPKWAKWLVMHPNGLWIWFEKEPHQISNGWASASGRQTWHSMRNNWPASKEHRPSPAPAGDSTQETNHG